MTCAVFGFAAQAGASRRLAQALGISHETVNVRAFPDGESLVSVAPSPAIALLYCSLNHPNEKLVEILLAASALRDSGATKVVLIAPYLPYMRQDIAFHSGEAVSQRVVGKIIADGVDAVLTLDPHLHRTHSLSAILPGIEAVGVSAAPILAAALANGDDPLLVGPDGEARQWVERIARREGLEFILGRKRRIGDREVELTIPDVERVHGRVAVLVDDLISTGGTLKIAARLLIEASASKVEALATHCLAGEADLKELQAAGIASIRATDSVESPVGTLPCAALLAMEVRRQGWCL
ncbi:MAG TPA: ribose-phosphate diphosphokinase [Sphingomicrobium sp.]|nr:ribose-phosphate diphosphokinase [Sphingomicrobium sp.]